MNNNDVEELYLPILDFLAESKSGFKSEEKILREFVGARLKKSDVKSLLRALVSLQYIDKTNKDPQRIQFYDDNFNNVTPEHKIVGYKINRFGKSFLSRKIRGSGITFGDNTNYAVNSPGTVQSIDVTIYKKDVQIKINEMQEAVQSNDRPKFLRALGYVLDKGVDVGIAVALAYAGMPK